MAPPKGENGDDVQTNTPEYRDRLRTWLIKMIDSGMVPGLQWENQEKTIFRMPWKHAGRQDYSLEEDSRIFMAWAIHSGRYREGIDKPEPIIWKTRLRCALNKMPDIREIPERSRLDISEPYRVYRVLPPVHKESQIKRRLQRGHSNAKTTEFFSKPSLPKDSARRTATRHHAERRLQGQANENVFITKPSDFGQGPRLDVSDTAPWFGSLPRAENCLLQGINMNSFGTPSSFRSVLNPYGLFASTAHRDMRHRSELNSRLFTYQPHVIDHPHQFLMHDSSIAGLYHGASIRGLSSDIDFASTRFGGSPLLANSTEEKDHQIRKKLGDIQANEKQDARCKIQILESEIAKWKRTYENERMAREEIERRHQRLQRALENVGGNILAMINGPNPSNEKQDKSTFGRRKYAGDGNHVTVTPFVDIMTSQSGRRSAKERRHEGVFEQENDCITKENVKRRHFEDDSSTSALDLSSPSPAKRARSVCDTSCVDIAASDLRSHGFPASGRLREDEISGKSFRYSTSAYRASSDNDEATASNARPSIDSPSASSNCSSGEEHLSSAGMSPGVSMFKSSNANAYQSFPGIAGGPLQVT